MLLLLFVIILAALGSGASATYAGYQSFTSIALHKTWGVASGVAKRKQRRRGESDTSSSGDSSVNGHLGRFLQNPTDLFLQSMFESQVLPGIGQMVLSDEIILEMQAQKRDIGTDERMDAVVRAVQTVGLPCHDTVSPLCLSVLEKLMERYYDEMQTDIATFFKSNPNGTDTFVPNVETNLKMTTCTVLGQFANQDESCQEGKETVNLIEI
jgi:hypothetical protein